MNDRLRVLIVDDHPGMLRAIARLLLELQYDVVGKLTDATDLLETAQRLEPDVIVLDMNLPGMDGLTACRRITQELPHIKVVVFTAVEDPDVKQYAYEAGAAAFVHKLASNDDLLKALKCLDEGRGRRFVSG